MRLLVTGAQGFLGGEIVKQLQHSCSQVVPLGRRPAEDIYCCDLTDPLEMQTMISQVRPDRVIHCAAYVPQFMEAYKSVAHANESLGMIKNLLATCGCPVVFMSSMTVYGSTSKCPVQEEDAGVPQNAYGEGKWQAELLLRTHNYPTLAIRIPGLFGPARPSGLIYNVLYALKYGSTLPKLPDSLVLWAAMHVSDAAAGVIKLSKMKMDNHHSINFGYRGKFAIDQFLTMAAEISGQENFYTLKHPEFEFDVTRADSLGVVPDKTFRDALIQFSLEI